MRQADSTLLAAVVEPSALPDTTMPESQSARVRPWRFLGQLTTMAVVWFLAWTILFPKLIFAIYPGFVS